MDEMKRQLNVSCPVDYTKATVTMKNDGSINCSNSCEVEACPTKCSARAILADPEESVPMRIVCPGDNSMARVTVQGGEVTWCSHEHAMPGCQHDCLSNCGG